MKEDIRVRYHSFFSCFIALINIKPNEAESQSDEATGDEFS